MSHPGVLAAFGAAILFGAGTPLAKLLLESVNPWLLAGLLYLGSGVGLTLYRLLRRAPPARVPTGELLWFAGAVIAGGIVGPVLLMLGAVMPPWSSVAAAMLVGLFAYGVSLALFVVGLRHLGTARTAAYFSIAPFIGAMLAVILGEPVTVPLLVAGALMALGVWWHLTENHEHKHVHDVLEHAHTHVHDEHHQHAHEFPIEPGIKHSHSHMHQPMTHNHAHFPDVHHRHDH